MRTDRSLNDGFRLLMIDLPGQSHLNLFHSCPPTIVLSMSKDRPPNPIILSPLTLHPEPVEGPSRPGVARGEK